MLPLKCIILKKTNEKFCFKKNGYVRQQKIFQELVMENLKTIYSSERKTTSLKFDEVKH